MMNWKRCGGSNLGVLLRYYLRIYWDKLRKILRKFKSGPSAGQE
jgi:hypothetical protein